MLANRPSCESLLLCLLVIFILNVPLLRAQRVRGELHIEARDAQGAPLAPDGELVSNGNQLHRSFQVGANGGYVAQDLPFGVYRLSLKF